VNLYNAELSIGQLARQTGVGVSTLRAWEHRYAFPVPVRLGSGHRRYTSRDVEAVRAAVRDRRSGSPLATALERARDQTYGRRSSVFGVLRHAMPDIAPAVMSKRSMVTLSHAMEDEIASRAQQPILIAAFQREQFWRASESRWRNLAQISSVTIAMASFRRARHDGALWLVPMTATDPLLREWIVICDSAAFSACVAAVELPDARHRSFEVLWSTEPHVVRDAARTAAAIASAQRPALDELLRDDLRGPAATGYDSLRATTALTNRIVAYLASPNADR
jgi:MerR family transcriptional regulator, light-induced transcriptional regulator